MASRLSVDDAVALNTRSPTTPAHTVALLILESSEQLSHASLGRLVASSLPRMARFRSRLVGKPLGVGQPVWAEIDDYDPTTQIHRATVSAPGREGELADLMTQLVANPLDRGRPLWQAWTVDGLSAGRWALAVQMSPLLAGSSVWDHLLTAAPTAVNELPTEVGPGPTPSLGGMVVDTVSQLIENQVKGVYLVGDAVSGVLLEMRRRLAAGPPPAATPAAPSMTGPVPKTMFNTPLTTRRSTGFASIPVNDVNAVSDAFGGDTTDVLLAACTLSLRAWLHRYHVLPAEPLVLEVPLSASAVGQVRIPVQLDDPVQILSNLHTVTERLRITNSSVDGKTDPATSFATVMSMIPPSVAQAGLRIHSGLGMGGWRSAQCHGAVSFVSGRPQWQYCAGAGVAGMYVAEPLMDRRGLNITVTSLDDEMNVCVHACPDNVPQVSDIASGIAEAIQVLVTAAVESPRGHGRSVVTEINSANGRRSSI